MYYVFRGLIFAGQRASGILLFCDATEGVQASELCDRSLSTIPPPPAFWPARARSGLAVIEFLPESRWVYQQKRTNCRVAGHVIKTIYTLSTGS